MGPAWFVKSLSCRAPRATAKVEADRRIQAPCWAYEGTRTQLKRRRRTTASCMRRSTPVIPRDSFLHLIASPGSNPYQQRPTNPPPHSRFPELLVQHGPASRLCTSSSSRGGTASYAAPPAPVVVVPGAMEVAIGVNMVAVGVCALGGGVEGRRGGEPQCLIGGVYGRGFSALIYVLLGFLMYLLTMPTWYAF
ncbi:hypothetical protein BKA70DRAFT_1312360 [Coprinopsis sp. MPI-PUGE-AT-0042]|nr:hypothetical protein BKA70DRAFT_1312360 [Coprinopsis sp. MPI-PUGE-AT-0042]